ncbi:MAG: hypothetical protein KAJ19_04725 [Gammaproteobacteria bacterium]|nr:hypothetical protein [Gammaproteobacteria bacterium]
MASNKTDKFCHPKCPSRSPDPINIKILLHAGSSATHKIINNHLAKQQNALELGKG